MGKINVLGFEIANLIAAGEVVDRPSSVIKELLENAIDAGAKNITVEIKNGGTTFMRITDDGCGMEYDDLPTAILRHATSKIKKAEDLDRIFTLGFRGEALAAISSVSKIRILSKQKKDEIGALLEAEGGTIITHQKSGCADGTTVIVEDLFYNVPARKKFLKKDQTETLAISSVVEKIVLSQPQIAFRYLVDGEVKYLTTGNGNLSDVIYAVLGREVSKNVIAVNREENGIVVTGFISSPYFVRNNRNAENFYINSRFVKSKTAGAGLEQAYHSFIPEDKFPLCVLNLALNPQTVDVNVHPAKLEVKFSNEKLIFDAVYYAVRTALENDIARPSLFEEEKPKETAVPERPSYATAPFPIRDRFYATAKPQAVQFDSHGNTGVLRQNGTLIYDEKPGECVVPTTAQPTESRFDLTYDVPKDLAKYREKAQEKVVPDYTIVGEAFACYVIVQLGNLLYVIDKHAAHERILFEDLKKNMKEAKHTSQMLLVPMEVNLTEEEKSVLCEWGDEIQKTGFSFTETENACALTEIPSGMDNETAKAMFCSILENLIEKSGFAEKSRDEFFEKMLYQASCKSAIKGGRLYEKENIKWIVDRVLTLDNIKFCPHGRPICFEMTKDFLEKQFERKK